VEYRIKKSILNWGKEIFGKDLDTQNICLIQAERHEKNVGTLESKSKQFEEGKGRAEMSSFFLLVG
jgi:hypothetical protein